MLVDHGAQWSHQWRPGRLSPSFLEAISITAGLRLAKHPGCLFGATLCSWSIMHLAVLTLRLDIVEWLHSLSEKGRGAAPEHASSPGSNRAPLVPLLVIPFLVFDATEFASPALRRMLKLVASHVPCHDDLRLACLNAAALTGNIKVALPMSAPSCTIGCGCH